VCSVVFSIYLHYTQLCGMYACMSLCMNVFVMRIMISFFIVVIRDNFHPYTSATMKAFAPAQLSIQSGLARALPSARSWRQQTRSLSNLRLTKGSISSLYQVLDEREGTRKSCWRATEREGRDECERKRRGRGWGCVTERKEMCACLCLCLCLRLCVRVHVCTSLSNPPYQPCLYLIRQRGGLRIR